MELIWKYMSLGFTHVVPYGYDHALFIICISLTCTTWRSLVIQCSLFTLAHSISLALAASGLMMPDAAWVEPLIALTILYSSLENIIFTKSHRMRMPVIFLFGLIHGMGFAGALREAGIPEGHFIGSLLSFNAGVEIGQILVILALWLPVFNRLKNKEWYHNKVVYPVSSVIALVALYWTVRRLGQPLGLPLS